MGTTAGGMTFYEEQFETGMWLGLTQFLDAFNASSGGAILLNPGARKGRKPVQTVISDISSLIQSRNPSGTGTKTPGSIGNAEHRSIKIFRTAPVKLTRQEWVDMGLSSEEGSRIFGEQFGQAQAQDYLSSALAALVGAITAIGATAYLDITGETTKTATFDAFNRTLGKLGDRRQSARTLVAYSKVLQDLIGTAFSSQTIAFQLGGTAVYNGLIPAMGLREVITDASPLWNLNGSATDTYNSLFLVPGAVQVKTGPSNQVFSVITGDGSTTPENQQWLLSVEYEYEITVKGVAYKSASADNPSVSALATSSNWTSFVSDRKLGPGTMLISQ